MGACAKNAVVGTPLNLFTHTIDTLIPAVWRDGRLLVFFVSRLVWKNPKSRIDTESFLFFKVSPVEQCYTFFAMKVSYKILYTA